MENDSNREAQNEEILALKSIFADEILTIRQEKHVFGNFTVCVSLPKNFTLRYKDEDDEQKENENNIPISCLMPIILKFQLSQHYPSKKPPYFRLKCLWLNKLQLSRLCWKLDEIWDKNEGQAVLYMWYDFLHNEALSYLEITDLLHLDEASFNKYLKRHKSSSNYDFRAQCSFKSIGTRIESLLNYNQIRLQDEFNNSIILCNVCVSEQFGRDCVLFQDCKHMFCKDCVRHYYEILIMEGNVKSLHCLAKNCFCPALQTQIKEVLSSKMLLKYDKLLLTLCLESMGGVVHCPIKFCQGIVLKEDDSNLGLCPKCNLAFCVFCLKSYHGIDLCSFTEDEELKLYSRYISASKEEKNNLEKKYGKKKIQFLIQSNLTKQWMNENSKNCPNCETPIEKNNGCNKMVCFKCQTCFCWLCLLELNPNDPYLHYFTNGSCKQKLLEGVVIDEELELELIENDEEFWGD